MELVIFAANISPPLPSLINLLKSTESPILWFPLMRKNTSDDFWKSLIIDSNGCWLWPKAKTYSGYGVASFQGKAWRAHRLAWTLRNGLVPEGLLVCHKCDVRACCNPDHLFLGSQQDNLDDRERKGRTIKGNDHWRRRLGTSEKTKQKMRQAALKRWAKMTTEQRSSLSKSMNKGRTGKRRGPYKGRQSYAKGYKPV